MVNYYLIKTIWQTEYFKITDPQTENRRKCFLCLIRKLTYPAYQWTYKPVGKIKMCYETIRGYNITNERHTIKDYKGSKERYIYMDRVAIDSYLP